MSANANRVFVDSIVDHVEEHVARRASKALVLVRPLRSWIIHESFLAVAVGCRVGATPRGDGCHARNAGGPMPCFCLRKGVKVRRWARQDNLAGRVGRLPLAGSAMPGLTKGAQGEPGAHVPRGCWGASRCCFLNKLGRLSGQSLCLKSAFFPDRLHSNGKRVSMGNHALRSRLSPGCRSTTVPARRPLPPLSGHSLRARTRPRPGSCASPMA
jgi:hypothetical protein